MKKLFAFLSIQLMVMTVCLAQFTTINVGTTANDGTGDTLRTAFGKVNTNFITTSTLLYGIGANDTNYVNSATNGLANTNFVLAQISATNTANLITTTNFVLAQILATNTANLIITTNLVYLVGANDTNYVNSATNGLANTNFVLAQISATNTANLIITTNLVYLVGANDTNYVNSATNGLANTNFVLAQILATNTANLITTTNFGYRVVQANAASYTRVVSNQVVNYVINGVIPSTNSYFGSFTAFVAPSAYTNTSYLVVSGITNNPSSGYNLTNFNGTYYWSNTLSSQGLWVKGSTNFFGYVIGTGVNLIGWGFTTNYNTDTTYVFDGSTLWSLIAGTSGTTPSGFGGGISPITFSFAQVNTPYTTYDQTVTFTLPQTAAAVTNVFSATGITLNGGTFVGNGSSITNLVFPTLSSPFTNTIAGNSNGILWNSNKVLYWVTATKTNQISDGR